MGIHTLYLVGVYDMIKKPLKGCRTMGGELGFPAGKTPDFAHAPRLFSFVFGGPVIEKADTKSLTEKLAIPEREDKDEFAS